MTSRRRSSGEVDLLRLIFSDCFPNRLAITGLIAYFQLQSEGSCYGSSEIHVLLYENYISSQTIRNLSILIITVFSKVFVIFIGGRRASIFFARNSIIVPLSRNTDVSK